MSATSGSLPKKGPFPSVSLKGKLLGTQPEPDTLYEVAELLSNLVLAFQKIDEEKSKLSRELKSDVNSLKLGCLKLRRETQKWCNRQITFFESCRTLLEANKMEEDPDKKRRRRTRVLRKCLNGAIDLKTLLDLCGMCHGLQEECLRLQEKVENRREGELTELGLLIGGVVGIVAGIAICVACPLFLGASLGSIVAVTIGGYLLVGGGASLYEAWRMKGFNEDLDQVEKQLKEVEKELEKMTMKYNDAAQRVGSLQTVVNDVREGASNDEITIEDAPEIFIHLDEHGAEMIGALKALRQATYGAFGRE